MVKSSNDNEYNWTFSDVRTLDNRLNRIENKIDHNYLSFKKDVSETREMLKDASKEAANHLVVDNRSKTDWKAIGIIIGATIATILAAIQEVTTR